MHVLRVSSSIRLYRVLVRFCKVFARCLQDCVRFVYVFCKMLQGFCNVFARSCKVFVRLFKVLQGFCTFVVRCCKVFAICVQDVARFVQVV